MEITLRAGKAQIFECSEYGYKLHFPKGALPEHILECKFHVRAFLSGQYEFPENFVPISAIYQITCPVELKEPVLLEIQHCAIIETPEQASFLSFVKAEDSHGKFPYQFKPIRGGVFPVKSMYAAISLEKFSIISAIRKIGKLLRSFTSHRQHSFEEDSPSGPKLEYLAIIYVTPFCSESCEVICVLIKNIDAIFTVSVISNTLKCIFMV